MRARRYKVESAGFKRRPTLPSPGHPRTAASTRLALFDPWPQLGQAAFLPEPLARRQPALRSSAHSLPTVSLTASAISAPSEQPFPYFGQHVRPGPLNPEPRAPDRSVASSHAAPLESPLPSLRTRLRHASLTDLSKRLPAPHSYNSMAFKLPPPPSTTGLINSSTTITSTSFAHQSSSVLKPYLNLLSSYKNMIEQPVNDQSVSHADPSAPALIPLPVTDVSMAATAIADCSPFLSDLPADMPVGEEAFRELIELLTPDWTPQLTGSGVSDSPPEETPLFTPNMDVFGGTPFVDSWLSPNPGDAESFDSFPPLFNDNHTGYSDTTSKKALDPEPTMTIDQALLTMPKTPALGPVRALPTMTRATSGNKAANGFRKGSNPTTMVPIDAPTQPRTYLASSKTSRKDVPAAFQNKARKRQREESLDDDDVPDDIQDQIAAKRRLNTLAARRSRARKAQTAMEMESRISDLSAEVENLSNQLAHVTAERDAYKAQLGY